VPRLSLAFLLFSAQLAGAQSEPRPLIPIERFVANTDFAGDHRVSQDGKKLLWSEVVGFDQGLVVREVDGIGRRRFATGRLARASVATIYQVWLADNRHFAYVRDLTGDENARIYIQDGDDALKEPRELTPWPKVKSYIVSTLDPRGTHLYFATNRRDASVFDLFEAEIATGALRELGRNPGDVTQWVLDVDGSLGGRVRTAGKPDSGERVFEVLERGTWREVRRWDRDSDAGIAALDRAAGVAIMHSSIGRDTLSVVRVTLADGREEVLFEDPRVDLTTTHIQSGTTRVYAVRIVPDYPVTQILDAALEAELKQALGERFPVGLRGFTFGNADRALQRLLVYPIVNDGSRPLLFDRPNRRLIPLQDESAERARETRALVSEEPIRYAAKDGTTIHGYLLRPAGSEGKRVPMVVSVHGGPWARDYWISRRLVSDHSYAQFLANRGYAVLMINYRGSWGYGKKFMNAAIGKLHTLSQDDIADGVRWAVAEGIADPKRVAISGGSFGGFSVYMNLLRSPELYACGISSVGVANWPRAIQEFPPYWKSSMHLVYRFYGDPRRPEDLTRLKEQSPIGHITKIGVPLLVMHGANDVRVMKQDSDDVVAALKAAGKPVEYLVFSDEGHSIRRWQNRLVSFQRTEEFLAACLGGRKL
jgi:dienelactone hydrolase